MAHVFISYNHSNRDKLEQLVDTLKAAGFTEDDIWYDDFSTAGKDWRDEIDTALKEAFAVAVIVTSDSMESPYVTYEWSWALGNSTPIVPLLFEDLPSSKQHARLNKLQYIKCYDGIPADRLIQTLREYQRTPPDTVYLNRVISNAVMPLRVLARISLWLYPYVHSGVIPISFYQSLIGKTRDAATEIHYRHLPELMVDKSHAFTSKQARRSRDLIIQTSSFTTQISDLSYRMLFRPQEDVSTQVQEIETYREKVWEPLAGSFVLPPDSCQHLNSYLELAAKQNRTEEDNIVLWRERTFSTQAFESIGDDGIVLSDTIKTIATGNSLP